MSSLTLTAPAKLNLFLRVLGRREDGYHELQTAFDLIDWYDEIVIRALSGNEVTRIGAVSGLREAEADLCQRAALALKAHTGYGDGAEIHIRKSIPVGAGLGGGSSDAATVLLGLNQIWRCGLSTRELAELGGQLGADIPFFLFGRPAFGEGIGERLTPIELAPRWYLVLVPDCHVSTQRVFSAPGLTRHSLAITIADLDAEGLGNDCESVVVKSWPRVAEALSWLRQRADGRMSGTGCAVFAPFDSEVEAQNVADEAARGLGAGVKVRLCRGLDRSTVQARLKEAG